MIFLFSSVSVTVPSVFFTNPVPESYNATSLAALVAISTPSADAIFLPPPDGRFASICSMSFRLMMASSNLSEVCVPKSSTFPAPRVTALLPPLRYAVPLLFT